MLSYPEFTTTEDDLKQVRMYILTRRDVLPLVHCVCQCVHAATEYMHYYQNENTINWVTKEKTLIVLEASENQIEEKIKLFIKNNMNYQPFYEPDMSLLMTAVAFQPITKRLGNELFNGLRLLK